ncbi:MULTISPECIES: hypothetical protein [unclassified Microcoleus]
MWVGGDRGESDRIREVWAWRQWGLVLVWLKIRVGGNRWRCVA